MTNITLMDVMEAVDKYLTELSDKEDALMAYHSGLNKRLNRQENNPRYQEFRKGVYKKYHNLSKMLDHDPDSEILKREYKNADSNSKGAGMPKTYTGRKSGKSGRLSEYPTVPEVRRWSDKIPEIGEIYKKTVRKNYSDSDYKNRSRGEIEKRQYANYSSKAANNTEKKMDDLVQKGKGIKKSINKIENSPIYKAVGKKRVDKLKRDFSAASNTYSNLEHKKNLQNDLIYKAKNGKLSQATVNKLKSKYPEDFFK